VLKTERNTCYQLAGVTLFRRGTR